MPSGFAYLTQNKHHVALKNPCNKQNGYTEYTVKEKFRFRFIQFI